jgi:hypothetical protein
VSYIFTKVINDQTGSKVEGLQSNNPTRAKQYKKNRVMQADLELFLILMVQHEAASDPKNSAMWL